MREEEHREPVDRRRGAALAASATRTPRARPARAARASARGRCRPSPPRRRAASSATRERHDDVPAGEAAAPAPQRPQREQPRRPGEPGDLAHEADACAGAGSVPSRFAHAPSEVAAAAPTSAPSGQPGDVAPRRVARAQATRARRRRRRAAWRCSARRSRRATIASATTGAPCAQPRYGAAARPYRRGRRRPAATSSGVVSWPSCSRPERRDQREQRAVGDRARVVDRLRPRRRRRTAAAAPPRCARGGTPRTRSAPARARAAARTGCARRAPDRPRARAGGRTRRRASRAAARRRPAGRRPSAPATSSGPAPC